MHLSSRLFKFVALFFIFNSYGAIGNTISYLHKDIPLSEITASNLKWNPFAERIYNGFDNGVYWFKVESSASDVDQVLTIPESHITRANLFLNGVEIDKQEPSRYIVFKIPSSSEKETYYLRVNSLLEARIPIKIFSESEYYNNEEQFDIIIIGIYIGVVLCILLINLFSYFSFGNIIYVQYIFMVIGMSVNAFYKDGIPALFIGFEGLNEHLELMLNSIIVISCIFFTNSYLQLGNNLKLLKRISIALAALAVILNITFQVTGSFLIFTIVHILHLASLDVNWIIGIRRWKKSPEAKLFTLAYGLPLILAHDYYISPHFGITGLNLPLGFYKIGSVFEMILFSWAVMYQAKKLAKENATIRQKLIDYASRVNEPNSGLDKKGLSVDQLVEAYSFTLKEIAILKDVALEKSNKKIAEEHFISQNTVKYHIRNILNKFEVKNRKEAGEKFLNE